MIDGRKVLAVCTSGLFSDDIQKILEPIYRYFYGNDWRIVIFTCCSNLSQHTLFDCGDASVFRLMNFDSIDAVLILKQTLLCREPVNDIIAKADEKNIPVIVLDNDSADDSCINISIGEDDAFSEIVEHLATVHGFKRINFLAGHRDSPLSEKRLRIFLDVLSKYGIPFDMDKQLGYGCNHSVAIRKAADSFISDPENIPEAVVCIDDAAAITLCEYLSEKGISVPQQITVTGFGGSEQEQYAFPRLTTCRCDNGKLAEFIFEKTEQFITGKAAAGTYNFPMYCDISESCGCRTCTGRNVLKSINSLYAQMSDSAEYDKLLNYMTAKLMTENNKDRIKKILKRHIPFDAYVAVNNDFCKEEQIRHNYKGTPFTDTMSGYRFFFSEHLIRETEFDRAALIPDASVLSEKNEPMIVFSIHNQENVYGYMAAFGSDFKNSVRRMQQFVMTLNNCISMHEKQHYLSLANKKLQQMINK